MTSIEVILVTLMPTLNTFLYTTILLEAAIYGCSNVTKLFEEKNMYDFYKNIFFLSKNLFIFQIKLFI